MLAVPGRVISLEDRDDTRMAEVDFGGVRKEVCLEYLPDVVVGEYVVVHVGFAIQRLDEESATATLDSFERLGILEEEFGDGFALAARQAGVTGSDTAQHGDDRRGGGVMKYLDEFSDPELAAQLLDRIHAATTRPWAIMEVCGGQTHSIIRHGIDQLLPDEIEMIHGPGCPVCVTPLEIIDKALEIAARPGVIFCSFGDMLRVPGSSADLFRIKSAGGDVRVVYSPLDALKLARENPDRQVVFFGIGFETTAPANAMTVYQAKRLGIENFSLLVSHVLVPPAIAAIMESPTCRVQAFLAAGHVCSVMGTASTRRWPSGTRCRSSSPASSRWTSWRASGARCCSWSRGRHEVENAYPRAVAAEGNPAAMAMLQDVFEVTDRSWRGIGDDPGQRLAAVASVPRVRRRAAVRRRLIHTAESAVCRSGEVLQGLIKPHECAAFGRECTPRNPLGATMVSVRGRLRRLLPVPPARAAWRPVMPEAAAASTWTGGSAPPRCATPPPSSWVTVAAGPCRAS